MSDLTGFSESLVRLVGTASPGVVAVNAGAYRTVSGVIIDAQHIAVAEHVLLSVVSGSPATAEPERLTARH
jgi:hypothetical protein